MDHITINNQRAYLNVGIEYICNIMHLELDTA